MIGFFKSLTTLGRLIVVGAVAIVLIMDSATRGVLLAFVAAVYGLRGWEKLKQGEA